jgi:hypothetical protein
MPGIRGKSVPFWVNVLSMCREVLPLCQVNVAVADCAPGALPWCQVNVAESCRGAGLMWLRVAVVPG